MTIHLATDHAGFALKEQIKTYLETELGYTVQDWGAKVYVADDDYPLFIAKAAQAVAAQPDDRAIIFGGSGQGEAMMANRFPGVRATVFYGDMPPLANDAGGQNLSIVAASRLHNDANVLSIGARYVDVALAKAVIAEWLTTAFSAEERHQRRVTLLDEHIS